MRRSSLCRDKHPSYVVRQCSKTTTIVPTKGFIIPCVNHIHRTWPYHYVGISSESFTYHTTTVVLVSGGAQRSSPYANYTREEALFAHVVVGRKFDICYRSLSQHFVASIGTSWSWLQSVKCRQFYFQFQRTFAQTNKANRWPVTAMSLTHIHPSSVRWRFRHVWGSFHRPPLSRAIFPCPFIKWPTRVTLDTNYWTSYYYCWGYSLDQN